MLGKGRLVAARHAATSRSEFRPDTDHAVESECGDSQGGEWAGSSWAWTLGLLGGLLAVGSPAPAEARQKEIIVIVEKAKALDMLDVFSKADFCARITIAGETFSTQLASRQQRLL